MGVGDAHDTDRKGCESIIHDHDCDLWVTMVGWVDVPYSGWGDCKRQRAVNISSFQNASFASGLCNSKCLSLHPLHPYFIISSVLEEWLMSFLLNFQYISIISL